MSEPASASYVSRLAELNEQIGRLESQQDVLQKETATADHEVRIAKRDYSYRRLQQLIRSPSKSSDLWPVGVMLVGPLTPGSFTFAFAQIQTGSYGTAFGWFLAVTGFTAVLLAILMFVPNNAELTTAHTAALNDLRRAETNADRLSVELKNVHRLLQLDKACKNAVTSSLRYHQELLLQQDWRSLRGPDWEVYLAKVFSLLGADVQSTGKSGDQGVDLIVVFDNRRYAIQAKGYQDAVSNAAVQEAVAGMAHYGCNCCAVITNSRFTTSAIALASSNRCLLVGEDAIPSLVLGEIAW